MTPYEQIFEKNKQWAASKKGEHADFFTELAKGQDPDFLYIGCSDSRVTAEEMMGAAPGEVFVHRNIANMVNSLDLNVMSVINYAVDHLKVKHIVVCGHYQCGGIKASMQAEDLGILNPWLRNIRDVYRLHKKELDQIGENEKRFDRLVEINVVEQCMNIIKMAVVQRSYNQNKFPVVHGWVFDIHSGELIDLNINFEQRLDQVKEIYDLGI